MLNKIKNLKLEIIIFTCLFLHILFFFYFFLKGGYFDYQIPVEAREYASTSSILSFLNNKNPYAVENFPLSINAYSALYPYSLSKIFEFFNILDFKLIVLFSRSISLFFVSIFIIYFFIHCKKKSLENNLILFLIIFFIISVSIKISLGTWGNSIGLLLYFIALLKIFENNSKKNYLISSICIILSVHFKFYFILGVIFLLMRFYNKIFKKNYFKLNILILIFALFIFSIHYIYFPSFYFVSILNQINLTQFKEFDLLSFLFSKKLYSEIYFFLKNYFYLLVLFWYFIFLNIKQKKISKKKITIDLFFFLIFLYILIFKLWPNLGNYGTYSNNLLIPLIIAYIINIKVDYKKTYLNLLIIVTLIFPLSTQIFNFTYPGVLTEKDKLINSLSKKKINDILVKNPNTYTDHLVQNFNHKEGINKLLYFNGNSLHITEKSILSYQNNLVKKIFKLDDLHFYYKENKTKALEEINKNYPKIICAFICFNSSLGYDFKIPSQNLYVLSERIDIKNIFGQAYKINIFENNNEKK